MSTPSVSLSVRLVPKDFAAVTDPRRIPARTVPFVWSEGERLWRSVEPLFVTAAKREGRGAYRAISELADGPFYHTALRIRGSAGDNAAILQSRLDNELLRRVAPQYWSCSDCQRCLRKEEAGPCARHQKEMPPAVLYKTTHPRVNRLGEYYVFGWASDYESTTPIAEHNDETWSPSLEAAAAEYEVLRETERLASEARAAEQTAHAALSPAEKQAAFERALFGTDTSGGPGSASSGSDSDEDAADLISGVVSASVLTSYQIFVNVSNGFISKLEFDQDSISVKEEPDRATGLYLDNARSVGTQLADGMSDPEEFRRSMFGTAANVADVPASLPDGRYPFLVTKRITIHLFDPEVVGDHSRPPIKMITDSLVYAPAPSVAPEFARELRRAMLIVDRRGREVKPDEIPANVRMTDNVVDGLGALIIENLDRAV